jgi:excinuclease ABC subunit A
MVDHVLALPEDTKLMILAPVVANRKGEQLDLFAELRAQGFVRLRVDGKVHDIDALPKLAKTHKHTIDVVVDRLKVRDDMRQRLAESFETALRHAEGRAIAVEMDTGKEHLFSAKFACPVCNYALQELEPRLFSFNNPMGACPKCDGLGQIQFFDPARVVAYPHLSGRRRHQGLGPAQPVLFPDAGIARRHYGFDIDTPFEKLPEATARHRALRLGQGEIKFRYLNEKGHALRPQPRLRGHHPQPRTPLPRNRLDGVREELSKYLNNKPCPECAGTRLRARRATSSSAARPCTEISRLSLIEARDFFNLLQLTGHKAQVGEKILKEITARLSFLINVGLDYLSLDRSAETLSGGEAQRIRLASQIGSGLTGVMYVLDEPSIGLHQRDNDAPAGNAVPPARPRQHGDRRRARRGCHPSADYVVDMGPGAGEHGGRIVAEGTPAAGGGEHRCR